MIVGITFGVAMACVGLAWGYRGVRNWYERRKKGAPNGK